MDDQTQEAPNQNMEQLIVTTHDAFVDSCLQVVVHKKRG